MSLPPAQILVVSDLIIQAIVGPAGAVLAQWLEHPLRSRSGHTKDFKMVPTGLLPSCLVFDIWEWSSEVENAELPVD